MRPLKPKAEVALSATIFIAPAFLFLFVYIIYSVFHVFQLSLYDWNGINPVRTFIGLGNWKELIHDSIFTEAAVHNFLIVILSLLVQMPIALCLAFMLDMMGKRAGPLKVIYYLPSLFSTAAVGLLFSLIYTPSNGILTAISNIIGGDTIDLLGQTQTSLLGVFSVICWTAIPFYMVLYLAAFSGLSQEVYEAANIDGANLRQYFFRIAIPMLSPTIKAGCTLSMIGSLKYFDLIYIMTRGGPNYSSELMATYMYRMTFMSRRMGYGATAASGMFIIITAFALVFQYMVNRKRGGEE